MGAVPTFEPPRTAGSLASLFSDPKISPGRHAAEDGRVSPFLDSCRIVAIAYGPGWQYDESDNPFRILPLGIAESPQSLIRETRLLGAFPNPCNGQTTIRFQLREEGNVDLRLCDATGRTVAILNQGTEKPGYYSLPLNSLPGTKNQEPRTGNQRLPPGIYFLTFAAPNCHETLKLIVAR